MTIAADFWTSKMTLLACIATVGEVVVCLSEQRWPTQGEIQTVGLAWIGAFGRDAVVKKLDENTAAAHATTQAVTDTTAAITETTAAVAENTVAAQATTVAVTETTQAITATTTAVDETTQAVGETTQAVENLPNPEEKEER